MGSSLRVAVYLILLAGSAVLGCSGGAEDAEAAPDVTVETFVIVPESFSLTGLGGQPSLQVAGEATTYTLRTSGTLRFTRQGSAAQETRSLESGDIVIERPFIGQVTWIRDR